MASDHFLPRWTFMAFILIAFSITMVSALDKNVTNTDDFVHLHIVPHTHNDPGWLNTINSYFKGQNPLGCVECILENITEALQKHPDRKFVYVEQVYFQMWWKTLSIDKQTAVKNLIANGQFEFLLAGYVMNDEACTYYDDIIEQITLGHRFIKSEFNITVNNAWHIDPFGHSAAQARLFSEMGFDAWYFERIDFQDFNDRLKKGSLEMIWRPSSYDTRTNFLFAHVDFMPYFLAPYNWCIDMLCWPEPHLPEVVRRSLMYARWVKNQTHFYSTKHIQHQIGGDFEWSSDAESHYEGLEMVIDYFNSHPELGIKAYFSTPSNYTSSVYNEIRQKNTTLDEKTDDFFPYQDIPNAYWTGYYTSKSNQKGMIREASKYLQLVRKLLTQMFLNKELTFSEVETGLIPLEHALGILQHHDAVTGTAKQAVDHNYINILIEGYKSVHQVLYPELKRWFSNNYGGEVQHLSTCQNNQSKCQVLDSQLKQGKTATLLIYNPSKEHKRLVKLQIPNISLKVWKFSRPRNHPS